MASFRFCRPDDIPLLVQCVNSCYNIHFEVNDLTIEDFKKQILQIDIWSSSCIVVMDSKTPIGVLIAAKREKNKAGEYTMPSSLITKIGIEPEHIHKGHGSHMLTSLRDKAAILGPRKLTLEIPVKFKDNKIEKTAACIFFEKNGYKAVNIYFDFKCNVPKNSKQVNEDLLSMITDIDLIDLDEIKNRYAFKNYELNASIDLNDNFDIPDEIKETKFNIKYPEEVLAWERRSRTIKNRKKIIRGLGFASMDGIEAFVYYSKNLEKENIGLIKIHSIGYNQEYFSDESLVQNIFNSIFIYIMQDAFFENSAEFEFIIPKLSHFEMPLAMIESLNFTKAAGYIKYELEI